MERLRFDKSVDYIPKIKLSDISQIRNGFSFKSELYKKTGKYNIVTIKNVNGNRYIDTENMSKYDDLPKNISKHQVLKNDDILVSMTGNVGRVSYNYGNYNLLNQRVGLLELKNKNVVKEYVFQQLRYEKFEKRMIAMGQGAAQANIGKDDIESYEILLPSIKEQEKIGGFLSAFDRLIEKQREKVELLKISKKGYIQHLFERSLRFKDESGNRYPEWRKTILRNICRFSKGKNISKGDVSEQGIECIRYGQLYTDYSESIEEIISKTDKDIDSLVIGEINDLLIPASGETREDIASAACLQKSNVAIGGDINILKSKENSLFLAYYLNNAARNQLSSMAQGASILHLYKQQLEKVKIALPIFKEQSKISQFLKSYDDLIKINVDLLDKYEKLKKSYLQRLFH